MSFGFHPLPSARRTRSELDRYVRSEYREGGSSWLVASCKQETCRTIKAEGNLVGHVESSIPETCSSASPHPTNCPVLNAIAESRLVTELTPRGELSGRK